jgi:hypothetical protein
MLSIEEHVFHGIRESVRSIVPSRLSISDHSEAASICSSNSGDVLYIPFEFENALFTSYVYKRNFRIPRIRQLFKTPKIRHHRHDVRPSSVVSQVAQVTGDNINGPRSEEISSHTNKERDTSTSLVTQDMSGNMYQASGLASEETARPIAQTPLDTHITNGNTCSERDGIISDNAEVAMSQGQPLAVGIQRKPLPITSPLCQGASALETGQVDRSLQAVFATQHSNSPNRHLESTRHESLRDHRHRADSGTSVQLKYPSIDGDSSDEDVDSIVEEDEFGPYQSWRTYLRVERKIDDILEILRPTAGHQQPVVHITRELRDLLDADLELFDTVMQTIALSYGWEAVQEAIDALNLLECRVVEVEESTNVALLGTKVDWMHRISTISSIYSAAAYRDDIIASGIFTSNPTALQLACMMRKPQVVEYLLLYNLPDLAVHWTYDPFILATKRRCKPILELFLRSARQRVSVTIINLALLIVVNRDSVMDQYYLDGYQNDRVRLAGDVDIVELLLKNGATPNARDINGYSAVEIATRGAESSNIYDAQIAGLLLQPTRVMLNDNYVELKKMDLELGTSLKQAAEFP